MEEDQKKQAIREYLMANPPTQEPATPPADDERSRILKELETAEGPGAFTRFAAGWAGVDPYDKRKDMRARLDDLNKEADLKEEKQWNRMARGRQMKDWEAQEAERDPSSQQSVAAREMAKRMFPGKPIPDDLSAAQLKQWMPVLGKSAQPAKPTTAQDAVDRQFAKTYESYVASGGSADVEKNLKQLEDAASALESDGSLTGAVRGNIPDFIRQFTNPKALEVRDSVEEVVQRNLREVLGAQFTEKEGQRLIARAYNEKLSEAENAKRIKRLMGQIKKAHEAKQAAARYYEENGTLKGFKGKIFNSVDDFDLDEPSEDKGSAKKEVKKKMYSASRNQTKIIYTDGTEEVLDGRQ